MSFAKPVFSRRGVKLLGAHVELTESMCEALEDLALTEVDGRTTWNLLLADSPAELALAGIITRVPGPKAGKPARSDYVSAHGVLAVSAGEDVQPMQAEALRRGGFIDEASKESKRHRAARMRLADELVERLKPVWEHQPLVVEKGVCPLELLPSDAAGWPTSERLERFWSSRVEKVRGLYGRVLSGEPLEVVEPLGLVDELVTLLVRFPARYAQLAFVPNRPHDHLPAHGYAAATLAVAIAARLGWDESDINGAGLTALLGDVGMMLVPKRTLHSTRGLSEVEVNQVWRHPAFSVSLLSSVGGLPETVRRAVYQHHERENGGGYPDRLRLKKISSYAKVAAVADAFAAATAPRPYRPGKHPARALQELVHLASDKLFDRGVARALVQAVGIFPVGSCVRLSTGEVARVAAVNADSLDRPLVRVYRRRGNVLEPGPEVDLKAFEPWSLHVVAAADDPTVSPLSARRIA